MSPRHFRHYLRRQFRSSPSSKMRFTKRAFVAVGDAETTLENRRYGFVDGRNVLSCQIKKKQLKHFKKDWIFFLILSKKFFFDFFPKILNMAPGFWGPTTSTLDWCEKNYEVRKKLFPFKNVKKKVFNFIKIFGAS